MRDPELESYLVAIEAHLGRRRGAEHVLSPRDFALAREWYAGGIPLGDVTRAIDAVVATGRVPNGLAACRRHIEARGARAPRRGPSAPTPEPAPEASPLAEMERALEALPQDRRDGFAPALSSLRTLRRGAPGADAERLARELDRLDQALSDAAVGVLSDAERRAILAEAERAASRQRGRVAPEVVEQARRRHLERRARERLGLPALAPTRRG